MQLEWKYLMFSPFDISSNLMYTVLDILVGPTVTRLVHDPLAVLFLDNQLYM